MKLSETWRALARTHFNGRGSEFLCHRLGAYSISRFDPDIDVGEHRDAMVRRIHEDLGKPLDAYSCNPAWSDDADDEDTPNGERRKWRAFACLLFACEAEDAETAQIINDESEIET